MRLAAQTGDLPALTRHLVRQACTQFAALPGADRLQLGVTVSAQQLLDPAFAGELTGATVRAGLDPSRLTCEIVDANRVRVGPWLNALADRGVRIALDARTTAEVTVSSLRGTAVHQLTVDAADTTALDLVLSLSGVLDTRTVVRGITSAAELETVRERSVAAVQGPLIASAMTADVLTGWMAGQGAVPRPR